MAGTPEHFLDAYARTEYVVESPYGRCSFRVGMPSNCLVELLRSYDHRRAAFLTAYNPGSTRMPDDWNIAALAQLVQHVHSMRLPLFPGEGKDPKGLWPAERSVLILGISKSESHKLARQFEQNAYVYVELPKPASLELVTRCVDQRNS